MSGPMVKIMLTLKKELHRFDPDHFGTLQDLRDAAATGEQNCLLGSGCCPRQCVVCKPGPVLHSTKPGCVSGGSRRGQGTVAAGQHSLRGRLSGSGTWIVCGHLACRVITYWRKQSNAPGIQPVVEFSHRTQPVFLSEYPDLSTAERERLMIIEYTLF